MSSNNLLATKALSQEGTVIVKGGIVVVLSTVVAQGLSMLTSVWIARTLGPDRYGLLSLALSLILPMVTVASMGLTPTVVRFMPIYIGEEDNQRVAGVLYSAVALAGIAGTIVCCMLISFSSAIANVFHAPQLFRVLRILAVTIPLSAITNVASSSTRGLKVMHFDAIVRVVKPLFRLLTWAVALYLVTELLDAAVYATLLSVAGTALVALILAYYALRKFLADGIRWSFKTLLFYSLPLLFSTLMYTLIPRIDRLLLGRLSNAYTVGVYSAAASLTTLLKLLHASIVQVFSPMVSDLYNRVSVERAKQFYVAVTRWDARLTFITVAFSVLLGKELLLLFGKGYDEAIFPFVILAMSAHIGTLPGPTGAFLQMTNRQNIELANAVIYIAIGVPLQLLLGTWLGWLGVAVGVVAAIAVLNIVQIAEIYHLYGFHPFHGEYVVFSLLSTLVLAGVAIVGARFALPIRFTLLALIFVSFIVFIYVCRNTYDKTIFRFIWMKHLDRH